MIDQAYNETTDAHSISQDVCFLIIFQQDTASSIFLRLLDSTFLPEIDHGLVNNHNQ